MKKFRLPLKVRISIDTKQTGHLLSDVSKTIVPKILSNLFDLSAIDRLYKDLSPMQISDYAWKNISTKKNKAIGRTHFNNKKSRILIINSF